MRIKHIKFLFFDLSCTCCFTWLKIQQRYQSRFLKGPANENGRRFKPIPPCTTSPRWQELSIVAYEDRDLPWSPRPLGSRGGGLWSSWPVKQSHQGSNEDSQGRKNKEIKGHNMSIYICVNHHLHEDNDSQVCKRHMVLPQNRVFRQCKDSRNAST